MGAVGEGITEPPVGGIEYFLYAIRADGQIGKHLDSFGSGGVAFPNFEGNISPGREKLDGEILDRGLRGLLIPQAL